MTTTRTLLALPVLLAGCFTDIGPLADDRDVEVAGFPVGLPNLGLRCAR